MKYFIVFSLLFSSLYAKDCYKNKLWNETICYYKYFDRKNIYNAKDDEVYYQTKNGSIYAISDKIEIKFHAIGAILTVLDDFEVDFSNNTEDDVDIGNFTIGFNEYDLEFFDKTRNDKFIFRVKKPKAMFIILRKLNELENVKSAEPIITRKYTNTEVQRRVEAAKARRESAAGGSGSQGSGGKAGAAKQSFQGGNFLKGGVK